MNLAIRHATTADVQPLAELNAIVQGLHAAAHPGIFQSPDPAEFASLAASQMFEDEWFTYVACLDDQIVGYVHGEVHRREGSMYHHPHEMIYVHQICVEPEARGRGIGTKLLDAAKQLGREHGINRLALDVWSFNESARRFFESYGLETYN